MRFATVMIVGVFLNAPAWGDTLRGVVTVSGSAGPPALVRIQLQSSGMTIQEVFPRERRFEFLDVPRGHYTLVASAQGYETVQQDIDVPGIWPEVELHAGRTPAHPAAVSVWNLRVPRSARRHFESAKLKLLENNRADALSDLKKSIERYPEYGDAHRAMGECYAQMNQLDAAELEFKRALEQPHKPELHLLLGKIYRRGGKYALVDRQVELYAEEKRNQERN